MPFIIGGNMQRTVVNAHWPFHGSAKLVYSNVESPEQQLGKRFWHVFDSSSRAVPHSIAASKCRCILRRLPA